MIIGQIQAVDPTALWNFLIILGFLLSAGASGVAIFNSRRVQKREVTMASEFMTSSDCQRMQARWKDDMIRLEARINRVEQGQEHMRETNQHNFDAIMKAGEERAVKIHERINAVLAGVSELKGRIDAK